MYKAYHTSCDLSTDQSRFVFYRWMHPSSLTLRRDKACDNVGFCDEYGAGIYYVLDCYGAGARPEIARNVSPISGVCAYQS